MINRGRKYIAHALSAPGASVSFASVTPNHLGSVMEVEISLAVASILDVHVTDGTTAYTQALNEGNALLASTRYRFSFASPKFSSAGGSTALTYSLQVRTDGIIQSVIVDEVRPG